MLQYVIQWTCEDLKSKHFKIPAQVIKPYMNDTYSSQLLHVQLLIIVVIP